MSIVNISSSAEFRSLLSTSTIVIADFYADWCGPCKAIAPLYATLSSKHSVPKKITFTKINVDSQPDIARAYNVSAMPTFLVFKAGNVAATLRGADQRGLTAAVEKAVREAEGLRKPGFQSKGQTLGGAPRMGSGGREGRGVGWVVGGWWEWLVGLVGLYVVSLFSLDPYISAERSMFNIHAEPPKVAANTTGRSTAPAAGGRKVGTLADLGAS